ncbi:unnamed protein product, partial [Medioppia subpectinata]
MTSITSLNEKTQLISSFSRPNEETNNVSYDSILSNSTAIDSIVYCSHGNNEKICCNKDGKPVSATVNWSHCHSLDSSGEVVDKSARRKLIIASILCLIFM